MKKNKIKFAKPQDLDSVYKILIQYRSIFPMLRRHEIANQIDKKLCVYQNGVVIIFKKYKRRTRLGTCRTSKGSYNIEYLAADHQGSGKAFDVVDEFCSDVKSNVWLCVTKDNDRAIAFYRKSGFTEMCPIHWANGKVQGLVFCRFTNYIQKFFK